VNELGVLNLAGLDFWRQFRTRLSSTLCRLSNMKFQLSTLFLCVGLSALAVGWCTEHQNFSDATKEWNVQKHSMTVEFQNNLEAVSRGAASIASVNSAMEIVSRLEHLENLPSTPLFDKIDSDDMDELATEIAVRELIQMWQCSEDSRKMFKLLEPQYQVQSAAYDEWYLDAAKRLWEYGGFESRAEFFEKANETELFGRRTEGKEYDSLRELIANVLSLVKTSD